MAPSLMFLAPCILNSDHVRERDKALLRGVLVGGVWNGFLLGKVRHCHAPRRDSARCPP